jgi:hypothetical protein
VAAAGGGEPAPARRLPGAAAAIVWVIAVSAAAAQTPPPLTSNRPGIGASEALVAPGVFQVETGIQAQGEPPSDEVRWGHTWGQLVVRYGLTPRIELYTAWNGVSLERTRAVGAERNVTGRNDLRVGAKVGVLTEPAHVVTLSLSPAWSFPLGSGPFTSGSNDGSVRLLVARSLRRDWSVSGNLLLNRTSDEDGRYWDNLATAAVARTLTPAVSVFAEVAAALPAQRLSGWTIDGGVAWIARPNLQWDVSAGHTLNDRGDDWFLSAGVTLRRP